jgi:adenine-specific DNA-methyltransferase
MATGIPAQAPCRNEGTYEITYPGKLGVTEIIAGHRAELLAVQRKGAEGRLYCGENLDILLTLLDESEISGKVDLIYIDPPFATGSDFESRTQTHAYTDSLKGVPYLEFLRQRFVILREILSINGSIYVHLDSRMICETKIIMDEVFGAGNFRSLITRKKSNPKNYTRNSYGNVADYILFYSKTPDYIWNRQTVDPSEELLNEYRYIDTNGRRHMRVPIHAPGVRNGETGKEWKGMLPPPGKHWQYKPSTLDELDKAGHIHWSANGNPRKKVYLDEHEGVSVQDIWMDFKDAHNQNIKITGYPTEKNPALLERIIRASSNAESLVLDCFAGSGTTLDVAGRLGRKWIGIDRGFESIATICHRISQGTARMGNFRSSSDQSNDGYFSFEEDARPFDFHIERHLLGDLESYSKETEGKTTDPRKELRNILEMFVSAEQTVASSQ